MVSAGFWDRHQGRYQLEIRDDAGHVWTEDMEGEFVSPQVRLKELLVLDGGMDARVEFGNGDGRANPGETIHLQAVAEPGQDLAPFRLRYSTEAPWMRAVQSAFLIASDTPEGYRIPFEAAVVGSFCTYRDTLYVEVTGQDETPPRLLDVFASPTLLPPGSTTTIQVQREWVVEGGTVSRMEAQIHARTDSQLVDTVVLQEAEAEYRGQWSHGSLGSFFVRVLAEDQAGNRMQTGPLRRLTFGDSGDLEDRAPVACDPDCRRPEPAPASAVEWVRFTKSDVGVPDLLVWSLAPDSHGGLWISSGHPNQGDGHGLVRFDGSEWSVFDTRNSGLPDDWVRSLAVDREGNLWIGTGHGLARFDGEDWEVYDRDDFDLQVDWVVSLAFDAHANLWIGTWQGLVVYREGGVILPGTITSVAGAQGPPVPTASSLHQSFPNPFNSNAVIRYSLPTSEEVRLVVYNLAGQSVTTLVHGRREAGPHTVRWDGRDDRGERLATGVYFYRLETNQRAHTRKLLLLR